MLWTYEFYTDPDAPNRMDDKPFLVLDLAAVDSTHLPELAKLTRESGRSCPRPFQVWFVPVRHTLGETVAGGLWPGSGVEDDGSGMAGNSADQGRSVTAKVAAILTEFNRGSS